MTWDPRADTRLLVSGSLTADLSQRATNLTASSGAAYEDPSPRTALDGTGAGRTIVVSVDLTDGGSGQIVTFGRDLAINPPYEISTSAGDLFFYQGGTAIWEPTAQNVDGTAKTYILAWATEPNPATTGASDALRSELTIYDVDNDELQLATVTHAVQATGDTGAFTIRGEWTGATMANVCSETINSVAVLSRFASRAEIRERFVAQTAAPTVVGIESAEVPVLPSQVTEAGAIAGPAYQAAAAAMQVGRNRHRLASPIIQMITRSAEWIPIVPNSAANGWPDTWPLTLSDGYHASIAWLWRRRVPQHMDWLRASIHWATRDTGAAAVSCSIRLYVSDRPPHLATGWNAVTLTRTTDDDAGLGVFEDFDLVRLRRDAQGYSWIWLAGYTAGANNEYRVRGLTVVPVSRPANNNQPPNQWGP